MQPFTIKTLYALLIAAIGYVVAYFALYAIDGWLGIILKSIVFSTILISGVFFLKISPDAHQLVEKLNKRFRR